jgi:flagellar hook-associated protein 1 FlgK
VTGPPDGFDIDLDGVQNGNTVSFSYTDNTTGKQRTVTIVRVDDPSALPLKDSATADPNDKVIGLDFSGGAASVASQLSAALATTGLQFSSPGGTTLRIVDDGGFNKVDVNSVSAVKTATSLTSATNGVPELPFFLDANTAYTGAITSNGSQSVGLAGRLTVNASLLADPSRLVVFETSPLTPTGDGTRVNFIYDQLANASLTFSPRSGIGTTAAPFAGTMQSYMRQVVSQQGDAAEAAANLKQGQDVVFSSLQERFNNAAGVNIDQEMANLLNLQNSYAANARVLSAVQDMIETLLKM